MRRLTFLSLSGILSMAFGATLFFLPQLAAKKAGISYTVESGAILRSMGVLAIGSGLVNYLLRKNSFNEAIRALLIANIVTHSLGMAADGWALYDEVLNLKNMLPVQAMHLFIGIGSALFLYKLKEERHHLFR